MDEQSSSDPRGKTRWFPSGTWIKRRVRTRFLTQKGWAGPILSTVTEFCSLGGEDVERAMSFLLKPRPRTWDLALDYPTAKQFEVDVTLDPATAGPEVILSQDLKEASWGRPGLPWPDAPGRFDTEPCLLGREGFTSGRHYWELEAVGRFWAVGVALESVQRKGRVLFKPSAQLWALQRLDGLCVALTAPSNTSVPLGNGAVGVYVDYEGGEVSFYAVGSRRLVFTFPVGSFGGQRLLPYFCVLLSTIRLSAKGSVAAGPGS